MRYIYQNRKETKRKTKHDKKKGGKKKKERKILCGQWPNVKNYYYYLKTHESFFLINRKTKTHESLTKQKNS